MNALLDTGAMATSEDAVLGGRLRLRQPLRGHRVGHDAILLAAATKAQADELAVDLGAGVGAAGLALAARIAGLRVALVEIEPSLHALGAENARLNGFEDRVAVYCADAGDVRSLASAGLCQGKAGAVLMNPPFNDPGRTQVSPDAKKRLAYAGAPGLLARWLTSAAWLLREGGEVTVIWRAGRLDEALAALSVQFGAVAVMPVLPRVGEPAIRVLLRAVKDGVAARCDCPPLILNGEDNRPTAAAEAVLREAGTLNFSTD
jgi:tRNA1(Val) A37 N6-methylase TrmN6